MPPFFDGEGMFNVNNTLIESNTEDAAEVLSFHGYPPAAWSDVPGAPRGGLRNSVEYHISMRNRRQVKSARLRQIPLTQNQNIISKKAKLKTTRFFRRSKPPIAAALV